MFGMDEPAFLKQVEKGAAIDCFKFRKSLSHTGIFLKRSNP